MPRKKLKYEDVKEYIESCGYTLLSEEYEGALNKLQMQCPEGHVFWMNLGNFKTGQRCPECRRKKN